ncbi:MAG: HAD family phosphatase [Candidatus Staskawiczbacteria bacterium]|nr:HAD family phosphatase [Candidatus Staskawiczbacteria bacterium]
MKLEPGKIKTIIFDWGGVCCQEGEPFTSLSLQQVLNLNPNQIADQVRDIYNNYYLGKYDRDSFWLAIMDKFGLQETAEINPSSLSSTYLNSYKIFPNVLEVVLELQKKYQVGLLSNLTPEMRDNIKEQHQLHKIFSTEVYSCDLGVALMKPDQRIYSLILERMKATPEQCLFIDNAPKNLTPAEDLGMQTLLFTSPEQFLKEVKILL